MADVEGSNNTLRVIVSTENWRFGQKNAYVCLVKDPSNIETAEVGVSIRV